VADPPKTEELSIAPNGEAKAFDRLGNKVTVPKDRIGELYAMGGRPAKKEEIASLATQEAYDKQGTATKVATIASMAGPVGYPLHAYLRGQGAVLPPEMEAYTQGVSTGFTGGLASVGMKEVVEAVGGQGAAHAYGQTAEQVKKDHAGLYTAGEIAGFGGSLVAGGPKAGLGGAAKVIPGVSISALGGLAEQGAARALAPVAAKGAIGRALATGGELAARGSVEGALYSGAQATSEAMLGDHEVAADKVFAAMGTGALYGGVGGLLLGGAGSLAASGARATASSVRSGIGKALSRGESAATDLTTNLERGAAAADQAVTEIKGVAGEAVAEVKHAGAKATVEAENAARAAVADTVADASKSARGIAEATGTSASQEAGSYRSWLDKATSKTEQHGMAQEQAWKAIGAGNGLQSTSFAKSAERYLPNGVKDVGDVILRKKIINVEDGLVNAAVHGTPAAMLPKIEAELQIVGKRIGDITSASPATIEGLHIGEAVAGVAAKYEQSAATRPVGRALRAYANELRDSLGITGLDSKVAVQDLIRERKALDKMVFENAALDPSLTVQVKRELRGELEGLVVKSMDEASGRLPGELKAEYKALKHDYTALSIASEAAEDSAARMSKAATFGLTDTLRGGGSIVKTVGSKLVRERGNAAAAVLLHRMADMGTLTKAMRAVDDQVGKAAKGLLSAPSKRPLPEPTSAESVRTRASRIMDSVAKIQADPERFAEHVARTVEPMAGTAPNVAGALNQRLTSAAAFMASRIPVKPDKDPFDPHPAPRLSDAQAATVVRYHSYIERPMRFFEELEHGKITHEGVEVIRHQMPGVFAELQQRTIEGLAELAAQGKKPPFAQRERLGMLLKVPATPSQRPQHMKMLQSNVLASEQASTPKPTHGAPVHAPARPLPTKSQPSTLDRLEGR
jgi:hypothetical protein